MDKYVSFRAGTEDPKQISLAYLCIPKHPRTLTFSSCAMAPRTEKMTNPAMIDVTVSRTETIMASRKTSLPKRLYDEYMIRPPPETPREKNI